VQGEEIMDYIQELIDGMQKLGEVLNDTLARVIKLEQEIDRLEKEIKNG